MISDERIKEIEHIKNLYWNEQPHENELAVNELLAERKQLVKIADAASMYRVLGNGESYSKLEDALFKWKGSDD